MCFWAEKTKKIQVANFLQKSYESLHFFLQKCTNRTMAIPLNYDCKRVRIYVTCTILYSMLEYMYVCICTVCMHCVNIYIKAWSCWLLPKTGPSLINYLEARFYMQTILYMTLYPKAVTPIMTFVLFISNLRCSFHRVDAF